jgi:hypothetical protein
MSTTKAPLALLATVVSDKPNNTFITVADFNEAIGRINGIVSALYESNEALTDTVATLAAKAKVNKKAEDAATTIFSILTAKGYPVSASDADTPTLKDMWGNVINLWVSVAKFTNKTSGSKLGNTEYLTLYKILAVNGLAIVDATTKNTCIPPNIRESPLIKIVISDGTNFNMDNFIVYFTDFVACNPKYAAYEQSRADASADNARAKASITAADTIAKATSGSAPKAAAKRGTTTALVNQFNILNTQNANFFIRLYEFCEIVIKTQFKNTYIQAQRELETVNKQLEIHAEPDQSTDPTGAVL